MAPPRPDGGITVSAAAFENLKPPDRWPRLAGGGIDFGNFARPVEGHTLIDGGVLPPDIELP